MVKMTLSCCYKIEDVAYLWIGSSEEDGGSVTGACSLWRDPRRCVDIRLSINSQPSITDEEVQILPI